MYPTNFNKEALILTKKQELMKQLLPDEKIAALIKSGKLNQTMTYVELQIDLLLNAFTEEWLNGDKSTIVYQISTGTQYVTDDEIYLDADFATQETLKLSKDNPDNFYILWEFEDGFLPYPCKVFFDGKVYTKDDKYDLP